MKIINKWWLSVTVLAVLSACTDDHELDFAYEKPESLTQMEYLNDYEALKSYVDRSENPDFKLGAGVTVSDYLQKGLVYRFINTNFDGVTAGNAMKYNSVVSDDGSMNFAQVTQFVEAAREAGLFIYGHTLLWHAQQNNEYLNSIIADQEIVVEPGDGNNSLHITTPNANANTWDWQIYFDPAAPLTVGVEYTLKMRVSASSPFSMDFWPTDGAAVKYGLSVGVGESWSDATITWTPDFAANRLQFCFGMFAGDLYFDDISLTATGSEENLIANGNFDEEVLTGWTKPSWHGYSFVIEPVAAGPSSWFTNKVSNSDVESDDVSSFFATEKGVGPDAATIGAAGTGADGVGRAIVVQSGDNPAEDHSSQFCVSVPEPFMEGDKFRFSMKYRAEKPAGSSSQAHFNPGEYQHYEFVGSPEFTTEWKTLEYSGVVSAAQAGGEKPRGTKTIAFNLAVFKEANTYYFDDIYWEIEESGNKMPLTPEEKADTLTWAMENWMAGMMDATQDYVTEWDVVNEAIAGVDQDGDGLYDLQSVKNVPEADAANNFYWQDYLGDDFVRLAVGFARHHGPANLKLFINDYNLESDWDNNKKLESLIHWIERWEADGVTVIDGIGTQMHVSYHMDPDAQARKEEHIVKMFELMAATGKLVKITELDMG
ncbi:MAG: endo-1,4-beta-xylanase, partial [Bacteroidales bacterium]|nr:endo-1,4-beta-xylanase [Bacteroidales bacterium]